jgi:hypothetical protein
MSPGYHEARVNIVSRDGGGLGTDIDVLTETLKRLGCEVSFQGRVRRHARNRLHSLLATGRALLAQPAEWYEDQAQRFERRKGELLTDVMDESGSGS